MIRRRNGLSQISRPLQTYRCLLKLLPTALVLLSPGQQVSAQSPVTFFEMGKSWNYSQNSVAAPALNPLIPYLFTAVTELASNRTATSITLRLPPGGVSNLVENPAQPGTYMFHYYTTNLTTFNATVPAGTYQFNVSATTSNQQVNVNLPSSFAQPNAPHLTNYSATQSVDPAKPLSLGWDAFSGGSATDYVFVAIGGYWFSPPYGTTNALNGLSRGITIPAGTLQSGSNYAASVGFYHLVVTGTSGYGTEAFLASQTQFTLLTAAAAARALLTNAHWSAGKFGFDVMSASNQVVTIVSSTNLNTASTNWPILLTTNSPGPSFHFSDPRSTTNKTFYYRARNGP